MLAAPFCAAAAQGDGGRDFLAPKELLTFLERVRRYHPNEEAWCLYGWEQPRRVGVLFAAPADIIYATRDTVRYNACYPLQPGPYGSLKYLGAMHTHPNGVCAFSRSDSASFTRSKDAIIDAVVCDSGVIVTYK